MDTDSFITHNKTEDICEGIANDVEKRFDTLSYEVYRPIPKGKSKTLIGLIKDQLGGKNITEFAVLRPKTYSYLMDDGNSDKKVKCNKQVCNKTKT